MMRENDGGPVRCLRRRQCQAGVRRSHVDEKAEAEAEPANQPQAIERRDEEPAGCLDTFSKRKIIDVPLGNHARRGVPLGLSSPLSPAASLALSFSLSLCLAPAVRGRSSTTGPAVQRPKRDRMQSRNRYHDSERESTWDEDGREWAQMICCDMAMVFGWDENRRLRDWDWGLGRGKGFRGCGYALLAFACPPRTARLLRLKFGPDATTRKEPGLQQQKAQHSAGADLSPLACSRLSQVEGRPWAGTMVAQRSNIRLGC